MTVRLDTQAFIWFNLDDPTLSAVARAHIEDPANQILISPVSYWEIAIKISIGKFHLAGAYDVFWQSGIVDDGFAILPIEVRHTSLLITMPYHHKDPFDRLLVAQALSERVPLISSDVQLDAYGVTRIW